MWCYHLDKLNGPFEIFLSQIHRLVCLTNTPTPSQNRRQSLGCKMKCLWPRSQQNPSSPMNLPELQDPKLHHLLPWPFGPPNSHHIDPVSSSYSFLRPTAPNTPTFHLQTSFKDLTATRSALQESCSTPCVVTFSFCDAGDQTQNLLCARQALHR